MDKDKYVLLNTIFFICQVFSLIEKTHLLYSSGECQGNLLEEKEPFCPAESSVLCDIYI